MKEDEFYMTKRIKTVYTLQHKYPWETDWADLKIERTKYNQGFHSILKTEPDHLIEVEYRVVKKEKVKLKTSGMEITKPVLILHGTQLSESMGKFK